MDPIVVDTTRHTVTVGGDVYQFLPTDHPSRFNVRKAGESVGTVAFMLGGAWVGVGSGDFEVLSEIAVAYADQREAEGRPVES